MVNYTNLVQMPPGVPDGSFVSDFDVFDVSEIFRRQESEVVHSEICWQFLYRVGGDWLHFLHE